MQRILCALLLLTSLCAVAHPKHEPVAMPKEFDTLKQLVGTWQGTSKMEGKDTPVTVVYELTAGGTAITEKLMPGTPHEMITVFHKEGPTIGMTHYCAMGNQPHMTLKHGDAKTMAFEMTGANGVSSMNESHMHALTLTMNDKDSLKEEWLNLSEGQKTETVVLNLKRKK